MENKIKAIMASIFEINAETINENSSPDTIEAWDSLKHMNLIVALEEEFDIEFDDEEIADLMQFKAIVETVSSKKL